MAAKQFTKEEAVGRFNAISQQLAEAKAIIELYRSFHGAESESDALEGARRILDTADTALDELSVLLVHRND